MQQMQQTFEDVTQNWSQVSQEAVKEMVDKYGPPDEYSASQAIWHHNGPWKRTIVQREETPHDWPAQHSDVLEQFIDYRVPPDKFDDLAQYDGSVIVERTKGVISARCAGEAMNFVALNLANDIVSGKYTVAEARIEYARLYQSYQDGEREPYTQQLMFQVPDGGTGDPDVTVIKEQSKQ